MEGRPLNRGEKEGETREDWGGQRNQINVRQWREKPKQEELVDLLLSI